MTTEYILMALPQKERQALAFMEEHEIKPLFGIDRDIWLVELTDAQIEACEQRWEARGAGNALFASMGPNREVTIA